MLFEFYSGSWGQISGLPTFWESMRVTCRINSALSLNRLVVILAATRCGSKSCTIVSVQLHRFEKVPYRNNEARLL